MSLLFRRILDTIAPRRCLLCGHRLAVSEDYVCTACDWHLPRTDFFSSPDDNRLVPVFMGRFPLGHAASWLFYLSGDDSGRLMRDGKYFGRRDICRWLGRMAAREFLPFGFFDGVDMIVPVPLTRGRRRRRGYNQSREIARGIADITGIRVESRALQRTHFRRSQTQLSPEERMANVGGAFRLRRPDLLRGRHILLVDDVITTGATMISCATEAAKAGTLRISIMSIYKAR